MRLIHQKLLTSHDLKMSKLKNYRKPSLFIEIVALQKTASLYDRLLRDYLKKSYGCKSLESRQVVVQLIKLDIEDKDLLAKQMLEIFRKNGYQDGHRNYKSKQSESDSVSS